MTAARPSTSYMYHDGEELDEDDPLLSFTPVPHKLLRKNSLTPERQRQFIAALAASGIVTHAARVVGASLEAFYALRNRAGAEGFCAAWDEAIDRALVRVEAGAVGRAIDGVEKPIVSGGKLLGWYRVHNEALVTFLLRQRRGDRYADGVLPGHPLYERIRRELKQELGRNAMARESASIASINAKIEAMRANEEEADRLLADVRDRSEEEEGD